MSLNSKQIRYLRKQAHALKPVVIVGQHGITDSLVEEIDLALERHELIKIRVNASDREARKTMIDEICQRSRSELIQSVGHVASIFRRRLNKPTRFTLPS
ncbi:MAG: ribosome assembly RNA-binding protein YhbY [Gammaproteobacteria bacterium]|nr:ribosome assembly RNA-binding protein YhbY [Gammaproteobacteria bacterium]